MTAIHRAEGRQVLDGMLGCHVCGAQFPLEGGVATFGAPAPPEAAAAADVAVVPADPLRIAALLDLSSATGVVVLQGSAADASAALLEMLPVMVLAVNPASPLPTRERFGVVSTSSGLPLRTAIAAGIALSDSTLAADAVRVLRPGGRLLAPVGAQLPAGTEVLARDDREWVAVKWGGRDAVQLTRR